MQSVLEMEESSVYQAIIRRGIDQGFAQGQEQGREQGAREVLLRQATRKFGPLTDAARARTNAAGPAELDRLTDRVLSATGWDELFAD